MFLIVYPHTLPDLNSDKLKFSKLGVCIIRTLGIMCITLIITILAITLTSIITITLILTTLPITILILIVTLILHHHHHPHHHYHPHLHPHTHQHHNRPYQTTAAPGIANASTKFNDTKSVRVKAHFSADVSGLVHLERVDALVEYVSQVATKVTEWVGVLVAGWAVGLDIESAGALVVGCHLFL